MFRKRPTQSCVSARLRRTSLSRGICGHGSFVKPTSRPWRKFWIGPVGGPVDQCRWSRPLRQSGPTVIVVDASVVVVALADDARDGDFTRARLRGERLSAPELVDLEVASVLRRQVLRGEIDARRVGL